MGYLDGELKKMPEDRAIEAMKEPTALLEIISLVAYGEAFNRVPYMGAKSPKLIRQALIDHCEKYGVDYAVMNVKRLKNKYGEPIQVGIIDRYKKPIE
ncbi:MAG: hypothetical protein LBQ52_04545 [Helicobacteraceae bacterium]|jgi:hypothetical protein|nr:hypothetical protein [Helicobacteraceae bacterium]